MKNLLRRCWDDNPKERPSFEEIFSELSIDISYFDETVDEEEVQAFLDILEDAKRRDDEGDSKDEVFNLRRKMKKISKEKETLTKEISKQKRLLKKLENEVTTYKSSQDDFIESLHSLHGNRREKNYDKALEFLKKSSEGGNMNASYLLGLMYENGEGLERDFNKAKKCYEKSAEQGNSHGYNRIGFCYKNGLGIESDYPKAFKYYKKASDMGNKLSINNLGICYEQGDGVKQDYSKAVECYKKASELGNSGGSYNLADCYEQGVGVKKDLSKAIEYYQKAADLGNENARGKIEQLRNEM